MASELSTLSGYYDRKTAHDMDYREYMGKQAMVKDIGTEIQRSTDQQMIMTAMTGIKISDRIDQSAERIEQSMVQMQTGIQTSIKAQTLAIVASQAALAYMFNQGFDKINNTLDMGFAGVSNQLGAMTASFSMGFARLEKAIDKMSKEICDRLDALHDIMNNPLLTQSRELFRRAVTNYNKGFFEEALADVQSAVEKNKTDYISWYLLGKVYLFGASEFSNVIDLEKAIEALITAAKYIKPDIAESEDARRMSAEMWFFIGLANYNRFNDLNHNKKEAEAKEMISGALEAFKQSWAYSENMHESLYNAARCKFILGNTAEAMQDLETVIAKDRGYSIKATDDNDFETITEDIYRLIERMKKAIYPKAKADFDSLKPKVADTVFIGGNFADMVKKLVEENVPETFSENMPYFDIRDGYEMFPVILEYLNMEYPCDRLVAELAVKDCPYSKFSIEKNEHPLKLEFFGKLFDNAIICWAWSDWERDSKIESLKERCRITDIGYPRLLTHHYDNILKPGKIEFMPPTEKLLQKVKSKPRDFGKMFDPDKEYSDKVDYLHWRYTHLPEKIVLNINSFEFCAKDYYPNPTEYNCSQWNFAVKWDKTKPASEQEFGIAYAKNENFFFPLCSIEVKETQEENRRLIFSPIVFFLNKETLLLFNIEKQNKGKRNEPIKVFQPGIMSKSVFEKAEQETKQKAEKEAKEKAEQAARQAEAARKAKAEQEAKEQQRQWIRQGLCQYCGGKLGGVFTKKCKECGRVN